MPCRFNNRPTLPNSFSTDRSEHFTNVPHLLYVTLAQTQLCFPKTPP